MEFREFVKFFSLSLPLSLSLSSPGPQVHHFVWKHLSTVESSTFVPLILLMNEENV